MVKVNISIPQLHTQPTTVTNAAVFFFGNTNQLAQQKHKSQVSPRWLKISRVKSMVASGSPKRWDRWHIIPQLAGQIPLIYTTYSHCLRLGVFLVPIPPFTVWEPETTIDQGSDLALFGLGFFVFISRLDSRSIHWKVV